MRTTCLAVLLALQLFAVPALADGERNGTATSITVLTPSSTTTTHQGEVSILTTTAEYFLYWGGSVCSAYQAPSDLAIQMLADAVARGATLKVFYRNANGVSCLVGFRILAP